MEIHKKTDVVNIMVFIAAIIVSVIAVNFMLRQNKDFGYLNLSVYKLKIADGVNVSTIFLIFLRRVKQFVLIYALMKLLKNEVILYVIIAFLGVMYGMLSSIQVYYDGFLGALLLIFYLFPHYILYVFLLIKASKFISYGSGEHKYIKFFLFAGIILCLGVCMEIVVSRFFLMNFYQYMGRG